MKSPGHQTTDAGKEKESGEASTGLPWPHTWRGVYFLVLGVFTLWVALLSALMRAFA